MTKTDRQLNRQKDSMDTLMVISHKVVSPFMLRPTYVHGYPLSQSSLQTII